MIIKLPRECWTLPDALQRSENYLGDGPHPEASWLILRQRRLLDAPLTDAERAKLYEVEQVLRRAFEDFNWYWRRLAYDRLLPDPGCRPELAEVDDIQPSWESLEKLLGAFHRASAWTEKLERKYGLGGAA